MFICHNILTLWYFGTSPIQYGRLVAILHISIVRAIGATVYEIELSYLGICLHVIISCPYYILAHLPSNMAAWWPFYIFPSLGPYCGNSIWDRAFILSNMFICHNILTFWYLGTSPIQYGRLVAILYISIFRAVWATVYEIELSYLGICLHVIISWPYDILAHLPSNMAAWWPFYIFPSLGPYCGHSIWDRAFILRNMFICHNIFTLWYSGTSLIQYGRLVSIFHIPIVRAIVATVYEIELSYLGISIYVIIPWPYNILTHLPFKMAAWHPFYTLLVHC